MEDLVSHLTLGKPADAKYRTSFGGGFHVPKTTELPKSNPIQTDPVPTQWSLSFKPAPTQGDVVTQLEEQVKQLQEESNLIHAKRAEHRPFEVESILHADYRDTGFHTHSGDEEKLTIEQVESMKRLNEYRLTQLEAEYQRKKKESAQKKTGWGKAKADATESVHEYIQDLAEKMKSAPTLSGEQIQYKAKFETYLQEKQSTSEEKSPPTSQKQRNQLLKFLFKTIDKDHDGVIAKLELMEELQNNEELSQLLGFASAAPDFLQKKSAVLPEEITFEDFNRVFAGLNSATKEVVVPVEAVASVSIPKALRPPCLLTPGQISILEKAFNTLDQNEDLAVKRSELCDEFRAHKQIHKMLHIDAVQLNPKEAANLETILDLVECDGDSLEDFITWNEFLLYFQTKPVIEPMIPLSTPLEDPQLSVSDLNEAYLQLIMDVFDSIPRVSGDAVALRSFLLAVLNDAQVKLILRKVARDSNGQIDSPAENVQQVFDRMEKEANKNITWEDVLGFFSKRGRPVNYQSGYDSDPEIRGKQSISPAPSMKDRGVQIAGNSTARLSTSFSDEKVKVKPWAVKKKRAFVPTVPHPPKFEYREATKPKTIKQREVEELRAQKQRDEDDILKYRYRAQPIPAEVLIPKLESILGAQEAKRERVRLESAALLEQQAKPFSFYNRDQGKKPAPQNKDPTPSFKANPVPIHATMPVFEKMMKNKEAIRKAKVKKAAADNLAKAKMPPRMEQYEKAKAESQQDKKPSGDTSQTRFYARDPPNFRAIHKAFNEAMIKKKESVAPTKVEPFNLNETRKKQPKDTSDDLVKEAALKWGAALLKPKSASGSVNLPEPRQTNNSKKLEETRKKQQEEEKAAKDAVDAAAQVRQQKYQDAIQRVKQSNQIRGTSKAIEDTRRQALQQKKQEQRERVKDAEQAKQEMLAKVQTKPLLVEKATSFASKYTAYAKAYLQQKSEHESQAAEVIPVEDQEVEEAQPYEDRLEEAEVDEAVPYEDQVEEEEPVQEEPAEVEDANEEVY